MADTVLQTMPLGTQWPTADPFLFCAHHDDTYPVANDEYGPAVSLSDRQLGQDFAGIDGWNMYHGRKIPGFPQHQIRQWIWIASQFRLHASDFPEVGRLAGSALNFMGKVIADKSNLSTEDLQDLNWVLGSATKKLTTLLGPATLRSYLSVEELTEVESRLENFKTLPPISAGEHRSRVESQIGEIRALSNKGYLATLCTKVDALIEAVESRKDEGAAVAGAALHYLADEEDAVPDSIGFLGLLDDIYVIEWAYSVIEGHTTWLPFLEDMLERWPFVDDLVFGGGNQKKKQRSRSIQTEDGPPPFEMDQPILIGDETEHFKALFAGVCEFAGPNKYWLKVRKNGRITISKDAMSACRPSPTEHKTLSTGNKITEWLKSRHPGPLAHIAGRDAAVPEAHQGVLLLTMKKRMEEFLPLIRPLGVTIPSLFGMRYVTTTDKEIDLQGSATDHPLIYACSDPSVALGLVKNRPDHLSKWFVIADGANLARTIQASLAASGDFANTHLCAVAELHDREACRDIVIGS